MAVASFVFVLEDTGWNAELQLVDCFQHLGEKRGVMLLYQGSLLVAERGRADLQMKIYDETRSILPDSCRGIWLFARPHLFI